MCLIAWNWQPNSPTPLLVVGNRDEFHARPAQPLHWWDNGQVLAGKDLEAGGTWMGMDRNGRFAALTNYRQPAADPAPRPSRGALAVGFLHSEQSAHRYLHDLAGQAHVYNPFNLLLWDGQELLGLESRHARIVRLQPGIGAVSNADFNTPWPKLQRLKAGLQQQCQVGQTEVLDLLPLLQDRTPAPDHALPRTGVPLELERMLSATFIASQAYGTRASSVVVVQQRRSVFHEMGYGPEGTPMGSLRSVELTIP